MNKWGWNWNHLNPWCWWATATAPITRLETLYPYFHALTIICRQDSRTKLLDRSVRVQYYLPDTSYRYVLLVYSFHSGVVLNIDLLVLNWNDEALLTCIIACAWVEQSPILENQSHQQSRGKGHLHIYPQGHLHIHWHLLKISLLKLFSLYVWELQKSAAMCMCKGHLHIYLISERNLAIF